jgi:hypothetical protein
MQPFYGSSVVHGAWQNHCMLLPNKNAILVAPPFLAASLACKAPVLAGNSSVAAHFCAQGKKLLIHVMLSIIMLC